MGFIDRLKNAWNIFKLSFKILERDKSLIAVPILMVLFLFILFGSFIALYFVRESLVLGLFIGYLVLFLFIFYFVITFLGSVQSWMIYEVLQNKNTTLGSGFKRAFQNLGDIFAFIFTNLFILVITSFLRRKGGVFGRAGASTIEFLAGIAGKLVIPAMIITERNFKEAVEQLRDSFKAIPEIATFEIGIGPLIVLLFFIGALFEFIFVYSFGLAGGIIFIALWFMLLILLAIYVGETYYTILYLTLIEKKKIKGLELYIK